MCDVTLLAFGALVIKSTAMLSVTAFFGAKARASECVKACLHTQRAQPRFAEGRGSNSLPGFARVVLARHSKSKLFLCSLFSVLLSTHIRDKRNGSVYVEK